MNEYRRCTEPLGVLVANLFDVLHSLCNLLLVKPENLQQVCSGEQLVSTDVLSFSTLNAYYRLVTSRHIFYYLQADLDRSVLSNFIQLRTDYKTHKLTLLKV